MGKGKVLFIVYFVLQVFLLNGQSREDYNLDEILKTMEKDNGTVTPAAGSEEPVPAAGEADTGTGIPQGFQDYRLGAFLDDVKKSLADDPNFLYRGDPDVSFLASPNESLIDADGYAFIEEGLFQFHRGRLYLITLVLNQDYIDHYTMYTRLAGKYGDPKILGPAKMLWDFGDISLVLEKPLRIKYIDDIVFESLIEVREEKERTDVQARESFLDRF